MREFIGKVGNLSLLSTLLVGTGALADQADVFNVYANAGYTYDSNLFRLDDGETPPAGGTDKSDNILVVNAGISINKPISQQRFQLDASASHSTYGNYSFLDYDAFQYSGIWNWHLTPRISGIASVARSEAQVGFDTYNNNNQQIRVTNTNRFEADYWATSNWHLLAGYLQEKQTNSTTFQQESDFDLKGWSAGLRYDRGTGRTVELRYFARNGEYTNSNASFEQGEYEARLAYPFTGKTRVDAVLAFVDRTHENNPQRDFDGWRGKVGLGWQATGKIGLRVDYERRLQSWQDVYSSYYTSDSLTIGPTWSVTAKQTLSASVVFSQDRYDGAPTTWTGPLREDDRQALMLSWAWEPTRAVSVSASLRQDQRDSNFNGFGFEDTTFGLNLRLFF